MILFIVLILIKSIQTETVHGCTRHNQNRQTISSTSNQTSVLLSCPNHGYILVQNLTFGVHNNTSNGTCRYQTGDCITRTTYIGTECNGLNQCKLDLNPQYLHICSQYSDYMVLDYLCLQAESLSICDNRLIRTTATADNHRLLLRSSNYPNEYDNSLNCSCRISSEEYVRIKFLDFYLEERDEMNICTRDYLQIENRTYCDSISDQTMLLNSSFDIIFKTNDVITRKGFWLVIQSNQNLQISCRNSFDLPFPTTTTITPTTTTTLLPSSSTKQRYTLSFILILISIFVIVLLLFNLLLIVLCWQQRYSKTTSHTTHQPLFCSKRSSSSVASSSMTYGETPVLTTLDTQKRQTISTTTTTYDDPNEMQQQHKFDLNRSFTFCPIVLPTTIGYNPMIHCHFNVPTQTFYASDSQQHIYETIQDGHCPYQRLAATLRRQQQQQQCTCYCTNNEQNSLTINDNPKENNTIDINPETLV